jgi:Uncharacterized protein conserved in bacteria (DUF2188)
MIARPSHFGSTAYFAGSIGWLRPDATSMGEIHVGHRVNSLLGTRPIVATIKVPSRGLDSSPWRAEPSMAKRMTWTVEPRPDGRWAVQRDGTQRADSLHTKMDAAVRRGADLGKRNNGQLRVKDRHGKIQDDRTYTRDPYPPRGSAFRIQAADGDVG